MRIHGLRGPDSGTLLIRAIRSHAASAGISLQVDSIACRPWASATFTGTRHRLTIVADPVPEFLSWIADLLAVEFAIRGHIVADVAIDHVETIAGKAHVTLAILTLIDA